MLLGRKGASMKFITGKIRNRVAAFIGTVIFLAGCGGGTGGTGSLTESPVYYLSCDLNISYTAALDPILTMGPGTPTTTVIALHGKNGAPTRSHMTALAADLSAQGYNVVLPYMPWRDVNWDGALCDGMSYLNSLIIA